MNSPNLFQFATSELSQDAFICWLLSWAAPEHNKDNQELHETAQELISVLLTKHDFSYDGTPDTIAIRRQYKDMDVIVVIDGKIVLLIEDKVHAKAHSDQLGRYRQTLEKEFGENWIFPVYFKTGDQSNYQYAIENGYQPFLRREFLKVLDTGMERGVTNDIFHDYYEHLSAIDKRVHSFEQTPIAEWPQAAWRGFFQILQENLDDGKWNYISNERGGFMGFWWHFWDSDGCTQYLQLEEDRLCFKIAVEDEADYKSYRQKWHDKITRAASNTDLPIEKPDKFGHGEHMTVAKLKQEYRVTDKSGIIDIEQTIERLREAEEILNQAVEN